MRRLWIAAALSINWGLVACSSNESPAQVPATPDAANDSAAPASDGASDSAPLATDGESTPLWCPIRVLARTRAATALQATTALQAMAIRKMRVAATRVTRLPPTDL